MRIFHPQRISGLVLLFVSIWICIESIRVSIGTLHNPGPGFIALCSGMLMGILSAGLIIFPLKFARKGSDQKSVQFKISGWKGLYTMAALCAYGFLLERLGFAIATFLLMFFIVMSYEPRKWKTVLIISFITAIGLHVLFVLLLKVDLPAGLLSLFY